jgi:hypothetical protein
MISLASPDGGVPYAPSALPVGPADADRHAPHHEGTVLHVRVRNPLKASGPLLARHNRHRAHIRIVTPGYRVRLTRLG